MGLPGKGYSLLVALLCAKGMGVALASECAPYTYGRWTPVGPGGGANVEFLAVNPRDANVILCASDACGMALSCDRGDTWGVVNDGIVGGVNQNGIVKYSNGPPYAALAWDPIDPNHVYYNGSPSLYRGRLYRGTPGRIDWTWLSEATETQWFGVSIVFDPQPDPNGVGLAQYFYLVNFFGYVAFTNDGGHHLHLVGRIPGFRGDMHNVLPGWQNPLLAVHPLSTRGARLIGVPCPGGPMVAWMLHDQLDPGEPNWPAQKFVDPDSWNDPNYWSWDDPNDPNTGLPDPNVTKANGLVIQNLESQKSRIIMTCNSSSGPTGGVYTRDYNGYLPQTPWQKRGHELETTDPNRPRCISCLTLHPSDPNICYVGTPVGDGRDPRGVLRTLNLLESDPNNTTWHTITDPNAMSLGHHVSSRAGHAWAVSVFEPDPKIIYFSSDYVGVMRSEDAGATWTQLYTGRDHPDTDLWWNRGLFPIHSEAIVLTPTDPNIFFISGNDSMGCFKTEDRGRAFRKYFSLSGYQPNCAPPYLTYRARGKTITHETSWFCNHRGSWPGDPNWRILGGIESNIVSGWVHPADPNRAWFVTFDEPAKHTSLVLKTTDGGDSLTIVMPDDACRWDPCDANAAGDPNSYCWADSHYLQITSDANCGRLYVAAGAEGILMSTDHGDSFRTLIDPNDSNIVNPGDYDPNWFAYAHSVSPLMLDANWPKRPYFVTVDIADSDANVIYCATGTTGWGEYTAPGYVYKSTNGGLTWMRTTSLDGGNPNDPAPSHAARIKKLVVHPNDANTVYLACYYRPLPRDANDPNDPNYYDRGIWKTVDGGGSWDRIFPESMNPGYVTAYCNDIAIDSRNPNTVYTVANGRYLSASQVPGPGVYVSRDGGSTWQMMDDPNCHDTDDSNFSLSSIVNRYYGISVHPMTSDLYVGTPAGGFWHRPMRTLTVHVWPDDANDPNFPNLDWGEVMVNPSQPAYEEGTQVALAAVEHRPKKFVCWIGNLPGSVDPCSPDIVITMDMDRTIWAMYKDPFKCSSGLGPVAAPWLTAAVVGAFLLGRYYHRRRP